MKITGSIIAPAMAGPTGPSATALAYTIGLCLYRKCTSATGIRRCCFAYTLSAWWKEDNII